MVNKKHISCLLLDDLSYQPPKRSVNDKIAPAEYGDLKPTEKTEPHYASVIDSSLAVDTSNRNSTQSNSNANAYGVWKKQELTEAQKKAIADEKENPRYSKQIL